MTLLGGADTGRADVTVATVGKPTPVSFYGGRLAWSAFDPAHNGFVLMTHAVGITSPVPMPPRGVPFDVDLCPDEHGDTVAVYSRCERSRPGTGPYWDPGVAIRPRLRHLQVMWTATDAGSTFYSCPAAAATSARAVAAVALGVPAGLLAAQMMLDVSGRGTGVGPEFGAAPEPAAVAAAAALIVLLAAVVGAAVARRAARSQVVEVLPAE